MLNYSCLVPVLFRELRQMTACRFTTGLSSRCALPEALQIPKSLDGVFPVSKSQRKRHCLCLHFLRACGMKTGAPGWIMQVTFLKNFKFLENLEVDIVILVANTGKSTLLLFFR